MAAPLTQRDNTGVVTGVVSRLDDQGRPYLEVARVAPGFEFGPVLSAAGELAAGDRVVAGFLEGLPDTPVILARVPGPRGSGGGTPPDVYTEEEVDTLLAGKASTTDPRLSDARAPLPHAHAIGDLPVAASGTSSSTTLVRADDARLADARTPTAHAHDDRYYTEAEVTAYLAGKANAAHTHTTTDVNGLGNAATRNVGTTAGTVAAGDDARLGNARTPTGHAATHAAGGSDPVTPAAIGAAAAAHAHTIADLPVAPSGTSSSTQVVRADDARLSNARTPTAHTHTFAGTWDAIEGNVPVA